MIFEINYTIINLLIFLMSLTLKFLENKKLEKFQSLVN